MGIDPITGSLLATVGRGVAGGLAGRAEARDQEAQFLRQAEFQRIQGLEQEAAIRQEVNSTLSTLSAARGANGLDLDSPTGAAIRGDILRFARQDVLSVRRNAVIAASGSEGQASGARSRGRISLLTGAVSAAPSAFSLLQGL